MILAIEIILQSQDLLILLTNLLVDCRRNALILLSPSFSQSTKRRNINNISITNFYRSLKIKTPII